MKLIDRFEKKFVKGKNCWEWKASLDIEGYGQFNVEGKIRKAHRVSLFLYSKFDLENELKVLHKCDNPRCVNPQHLYIGTQRQNVEDREIRQRRNVKGERHPQAKLNNQKVMEIFRKHKEGKTQTSLAKEYGITQKNIWAILYKVNWSHLNF